MDNLNTNIDDFTEIVFDYIGLDALSDEQWDENADDYYELAVQLYRVLEYSKKKLPCGEVNTLTPKIVGKIVSLCLEFTKKI